MSTEIQALDLSYQAAADYYTSSKQFYIMKLNSSGYAELSGAADAAMIGPLQNKPKQYEAASVRHLGISKVICGASFSAGTKLTSDSSGKATTATAGQKYFGTAQEAGVSGRIISVLMEHGYMPAGQ